MKQKNIFLSGEADSWFERNEEVLYNKDFSQDLVVSEIDEWISISTLRKSKYFIDE